MKQKVTYELTEEELIKFGDTCSEKAIQKYREQVEFGRKITVEQAAFESGKTERTIRNWIANGSLQARTKDGRSNEIDYGVFLKRINRA